MPPHRARARLCKLWITIVAGSAVCLAQDTAARLRALDNELRDHNLFQAICRTNRLDGDDKDYGHIVDYKELFAEVQESIAVYSSDELDIDEGSGGDNNVRLKDWLVEGKKRFDAAREALHYLCQPVPPPREIEQYLQYFCGDAADPYALANTEPIRIAFYKAVVAFVRAYAAVAQNLIEAGYSDTEIGTLQQEVQFYSDTRSAIKKHSGEELDIKPYEADMRHLINTYIQADPSTDLGWQMIQAESVYRWPTTMGQDSI